MLILKSPSVWVEKLMAALKYAAIVIFSIVIIGCNDSGSSEDVAQPFEKVALLSTKDDFVSLQLSSKRTNNVVETINLSNNILLPDGVDGEPVISYIQDLNGDNHEVCRLKDMKGLDFQIDTSTPKSCVYQVFFKVSDYKAVKENSLKVAIVVSAQNDMIPEQLSPLSETIQKDECKTIDINDAYSGQYDLSDYTLDSSLLSFGGGVNATANIDGPNTIYACGLEPSANQIYFSLSSPDGEKTSGVLSLSVSAQGTIAPVADNFIGPTVKPGIATQIDVCPSGIIGDETSDDCHIATENVDKSLQVLDTYAFDAQVSVADPSDINNQAINFMASENGTYDVSYLISDHRGGYDVGVIRVVVSDEEPEPTWTDITLSDGTVYTAPLTDITAAQEDKPIQDTFSDSTTGFTYNVATYSLENAKSLCALEGLVVPSYAELSALYSEVGNVTDSEGWPTGQPYWIDLRDPDDPNMFALDLSTGMFFNANNDSRYYVTCIEAPEPEIEYTLTTTATDADVTEQATVTATLLADGSPVEGETIQFSFVINDGTGSLVNSNGITNAQGKATAGITTNSDTDISYDVKASYENLSSTVTVNFTKEEKLVKALSIQGPTEIDVEDDPATMIAVLQYTDGTMDIIENEGSDLIKWLSSEPTVADITGNGILIPFEPGTTTIHAYYLGDDTFENQTIYDTQEVTVKSKSGGRALRLEHREENSSTHYYVDGSSNATVDFFLDVFEYCEEFDFPAGQGPGDDVSGQTNPIHPGEPVPIDYKEAYVDTAVFKSKPGTELAQQVADGYALQNRLSGWISLESNVDRAALSGDDSCYTKYDDSIPDVEQQKAQSNATPINIVVL